MLQNKFALGRLKGIIKSTTPLYFLEDLFTTLNNLISFKAGLICAGFYLEFIGWRRSHEWPKATSFLGGPGASPPPPPKDF